MPAGISTSDFYYILPELVLTAGALVVLIADVLLPKDRRAALSWVTLIALGATLASLAPFASTRVEIAHAEPLGAFTAWRAQRPVVQWAVTR